VGAAQKIKNQTFFVSKKSDLTIAMLLGHIFSRTFLSALTAGRGSAESMATTGFRLLLSGKV
jgi:hypothetical protein